MKLKETLLYLLPLAFIICCGGSTNDGNDKNQIPPSLIGKVLPDWEEGYLDIHAINTGRGECTLFIFPDGTTMLVDAASSLISTTHEIPPVPAKPNSLAVSGQTISNYVNHFIKTASKKLNYIMVSHWHEDHMGGVDTTLPLHSSGQFYMNGITQVGANIKFDKIIDRGYPDYDYPEDMSTILKITNYIRFINWAKDTFGSTAEQFEVGTTAQIVLQEDPSKYTNFQIRNIIGNGKVWSGSGNGVRNTLPENLDELLAANPDENIFSLGFHLKYGLFDYFSGGDLQYNNRSTYPWLDVELPVAQVMCAVDVLKANHHGTANCNSDAFLNKLKPMAIIIHTWRDVQPNPETVGRMFAANKDCQIFTTNMTNNNKVRLKDYISRIKSQNGHVVVRVEPGGGRYTIYVLDDTNEKYLVEKIFGPYHSN